ncbi:hypothetical protein [Micromonospora sp. NBC_01412]|uniref:hypothetical protein n=1 Tax=Micromonospora sp. NBC_01412 TaxID=2903590 RepID=UPI003256815B
MILVLWVRLAVFLLVGTVWARRVAGFLGAVVGAGLDQAGSGREAAGVGQAGEFADFGAVTQAALTLDGGDAAGTSTGRPSISRME